MTETKLRSLTASESETLSNFLGHIALPGGSSVELAKPTSSGGGKFDEAKVKRDNNGKFSTKPGSSDPKDKDWLSPKNIKALTQQLLFNHGDEIQPAMDAIMKKYGLPSTDFRKSPKAGHEALVQASKILNNFASIETASPSGNLQLEFGPNDAGTNIEGKVVPRKTMAHDEFSVVDDFLAHFGRLGMKWGRHIFTSGSSTSTSGESTSTSTAKGSSGSSSAHPAVSTHVSDAQKAAAIQSKARKQGLNSLSNEEMQVLVTRLNLSAQYSKLTARPSKIEQGRKFLDNQLKTGKTINDAIAFANSPAGHLLASAMRPSSKGRHAGGGTLLKKK